MKREFTRICCLQLKLLNNFSSYLFNWLIFNTLLDRSCESGPAWLVFDIRGKVFSLSPWKYVCCRFFMYDLYYVVVSLYSKLKYLILSHTSCIDWDDHVGFPPPLLLYSIDVVCYIDQFSCVESSLQSSNKSYLVMVYKPLSIMLNSIFVEIFGLVYIRDIGVQFSYSDNAGFEV